MTAAEHGKTKQADALQISLSGLEAARDALIQHATVDPISETARAERDRLLIAATLGFIVATVRTPPKITLGVAEYSASDIAYLPVGLSVIIAYFIISYGLVGWLDRSRRAAAIRVSFAPLISSVETVVLRLAGKIHDRGNEIEALQVELDAASNKVEELRRHYSGVSAPILAADAAYQDKVAELERHILAIDELHKEGKAAVATDHDVVKRVERSQRKILLTMLMIALQSFITYWIPLVIGVITVMLLANSWRPLFQAWLPSASI